MVNALALPVVGEIRLTQDVDHLTHVPYWSGHDAKRPSLRHCCRGPYPGVEVRGVKVPKYQCRVSVLQASVPSAQDCGKARAEGEGTKEAAGASVSIDGTAWRCSSGACSGASYLLW